MIGLVDCNNFYASCERVFRPELNGKPVVVLSNNDGCVIARSNEAKALDIPMGAPAFKYKDMFEKNDVTVFSSNFALYGDLSSRVMNILASYAPEIEIYSIDESFIKFDGLKYCNLEQYCHEIKDRIFKWVGIPTCIGIANTKALAKVANRIAKKYQERTNGVYVIDTEEKRIKALKWLDISDVWGIGRQHSKKLHYYGVKTAWDYTRLSDAFVKREFTIVGLRLKHDLEGKRTLQLDQLQDKKAIGVSRTFDQMLSSFEDVKERVATYVTRCGEKLRKQNSDCNLLTVYLQTNPFRTDLPQYSRSIIVKTCYPTNSTIHLIHLASNALQSIYKEGFHYKRAGVLVTGLTPASSKQLNLFVPEDHKHRTLMKSVDAINKAIGQSKVKFAAESLDRNWKIKQ